MTVTSATESQPRLHTIGAVCRRLQAEFADVSISKIRYLEDQGLLAPKRTRGGYRMFSEEDVERLQTILRLQRDEFLPLRVIRQVIASPETAAQRRRRGPATLGAAEEELTFAELCEQGGLAADFARELEQFGLLAPRAGAGERRYPTTDADIAATCARLAQYGVAPRNLRAFRTATDRSAALLEQIVAPALRSRNPERRLEALDTLKVLAETVQELTSLLLSRDLRRLAAS